MVMITYCRTPANPAFRPLSRFSQPSGLGLAVAWILSHMQIMGLARPASIDLIHSILSRRLREILHEVEAWNRFDRIGLVQTSLAAATAQASAALRASPRPSPASFINLIISKVSSQPHIVCSSIFSRVRRTTKIARTEPPPIMKPSTAEDACTATIDSVPGASRSHCGDCGRLTFGRWLSRYRRRCFIVPHVCLAIRIDMLCSRGAALGSGLSV